MVSCPNRIFQLCSRKMSHHFWFITKGVSFKDSLEALTSTTGTFFCSPVCQNLLTFVAHITRLAQKTGCSLEPQTSCTLPRHKVRHMKANALATANQVALVTIPSVAKPKNMSWIKFRQLVTKKTCW